MPLRDGSNRFLGAQEGLGGQFILKYNLLGPCPVNNWLWLAQGAGAAGFKASRHQMLKEGTAGGRAEWRTW